MRFHSFLFITAIAASVSSAYARFYEIQQKVPELLPIPQPVTGRGDPELARAWHLRKINAERAWSYTEGSATLSIVDSGIDYRHLDLRPNLSWNNREWPNDGKDSDGNGFQDDVIGWDFVTAKPLPYDRSGHGTFLASIAAAARDNGVGTVGVCPKCKLLTARFLNWEGVGDTEDALDGILYSIKAGARVINISFAGEGYDKDLHEVLKEAERADVLVVIAASNDGLNLDRENIYPAKFNLSNTITVAASDVNDELWQHSNWGKKTVHLAAPGVDIIGPWFGKYDTGSGTSNATAVVSAAATLLRSIDPDLKASDLKKVLLATVKKHKHLEMKLVTGGVLDLGAAARCVAEKLVPHCQLKNK